VRSSCDCDHIAMQKYGDFCKGLKLWVAFFRFCIQLELLQKKLSECITNLL
jgi:hypothetical protein